MKKLVLAAQQGDKQAFSELIEANKQRMYKIARTYFREQMDIDDAIAETVLSCWRKIRTLKEPKSFAAWLMKIHINNCNAQINANKRYISLDDLSESDIPAQQTEPDDFTGLLSLADERYRQILLLYYGEGFRIKEISGIMSMPENTVSSYLKRGREQIAKRLKERGLDDE